MAARSQLDALRATVGDLVSLTANASARDLARSPGRGEWSAAQIVGHLADAELVYSTRVRMILTADEPALAPYDEQAWAERFGPCDADTATSLTRFRVLRDANVRLFENLDEPEWERIGRHAERGPLSVADILGLVVAHDRTHLDQIRRTL